MYDQRVILPEQLPVREKDRKCTDCCCTILSSLFALFMFITALILWFGSTPSIKIESPSHHSQVNIGANGRPCKEDQFLQYRDHRDSESGVCVNQCPEQFTPSDNRVCFPIDNDEREKYAENPDVTRSFDRSGFCKTLFYTFFIAIGCGLLRMVMTQCLARRMPIISFLVAIVLLIVFALVAFFTQFVYKSLGSWTWLLIAVLLILAIILSVMLCKYANEIKFQGYMLEYASRFLFQNPLVFLYIPIFLLLHLGLASLIIWQYNAFSSLFNHNRSYKGLADFGADGLLGVLNVLEYLWALQFLRDAFNFCVSGNAVNWYWTRKASCYQPFQRLVCKNWGSVAGGSFLNAFFEVPTLIVELLVCHPQTCCSKLGTLCYNKLSICTSFFDIVRTDAYSYINLTGIPFCDSARQTSRLCDRSNQFVGYHSAMKHYRFAAHIACIAFVFFWAFWVLNYRTFNYSLWQVGILIIFIYSIVTWFIGIQTDAAEGLQTSYLAEHELEGEHQYMQKIHPSIRKLVQALQRKIITDGNL